MQVNLRIVLVVVGLKAVDKRISFNVRPFVEWQVEGRFDEIIDLS